MRNNFCVPRLKEDPSKAKGGQGPRVEPETTKNQDLEMKLLHFLLGSRILLLISLFCWTNESNG